MQAAAVVPLGLQLWGVAGRVNRALQLGRL